MSEQLHFFDQLRPHPRVANDNQPPPSNDNQPPICWCGARGHFGYGFGASWRCFAHRPEQTIVPLGAKRLERCDYVARRRTEICRAIGARARNGEPMAGERKDRNELLGVRCEMAGWIYLFPTQWVDIEDRPSGCADLGGFIDVKGASKLTHRLPVQKDEKNSPSNRAYLLICEDFPFYHVKGWVWGHEAKKPEYWDDNVEGPAFFVPQRVLRSPGSLWDRLHVAGKR